MKTAKKTICEIESRIIPTYREPKACEMPLYSEFRQHQGSTGYAYPNRVVQSVERNTLSDVEYEVIRLENDHIRLLILPAIGGRIFEGYDKKNDYHFLYRHSRIKPVLVGNYGSWISGGMEWNYPFHHRPSTFLPVDYHIERREDGSVICWLSEHSISPGQYRIKGMVGVMLRPDTTFFETRVVLCNRTEKECPFMWFENAGVHVNSDYQLFFPQDVNWVHHHYDRHHASFPIHKGWYAVENHQKATDLSIHKNTIKGNSYFAGPSKYEFFGGYDHRRQCGTMHVGNPFITPGKKMFQWALEDLGDAWNANLTDLDGEHAELMAGSYADDQPDFSWLAPYETKCFSQFWYPFSKIGIPTFANVHGAVALDRDKQEIRLLTTRETTGRFSVYCKGRLLLDEIVSIPPGESTVWQRELPPEAAEIRFVSEAGGECLIKYIEDVGEIIRMPADTITRTKPHDLKTAQEITIAGRHIEQYRDPVWRKEEFYEVALRRDPEYVPALLGMAGVMYESGLYQDALSSLWRAEKIQNSLNTNPSDGSLFYMKGLCYFRLGRLEEAYSAFYKSSWSHNVISYSMTFLAAIDGQRGDWPSMQSHARLALKREHDHPLAGSYLAIALWKAACEREALSVLLEITDRDPLDHLARYLMLLVQKASIETFFHPLRSNPSQTCLDVVFDLTKAGCYHEAEDLLRTLRDLGLASDMALYTLDWLSLRCVRTDDSAPLPRAVPKPRAVDTFPYRHEEIDVLKSALEANPLDAHAANLLGCVLYDKRRVAECKEAWEAAVKNAPDYYMPYRNLAVLHYSRLGRRDEALPLLKKSLELSPQDDFLLKEANYVMARLGVDGRQRLDFLLANLPDSPSDHLTWELADAYNNVFEFHRALETLGNHEFVAAECCETYLTEAYTYACCCLGRQASAAGRLDEALDWFRKGQKLPANFRAGWWDTQALYYIRYFEAETLLKLGHSGDALLILKQIIEFVRSEYSPYMGPEVDYYIACSHRLLGDEVTARVLLSKCVMRWEEDLQSDIDRKPPATALYISYVDDWAKWHKSTILSALAYSRIFFNDPSGALNLFRSSLELMPDNLKAHFEIRMLESPILL
jgi:tetratricopeptide (TPR) repeat protein